MFLAFDEQSDMWIIVFFLMLMMIGFHFVITVDIGDDCRSLELPEKTVHFTKDH